MNWNASPPVCSKYSQGSKNCNGSPLCVLGKVKLVRTGMVDPPPCVVSIIEVIYQAILLCQYVTIITISHLNHQPRLLFGQMMNNYYQAKGQKT